MTIFWDPRTGSKRPGQRASHLLAKEAIEVLGVAIEPTSMEFGDFCFFGNGPEGPIKVGIELKTVQDFVTSMLSGRLAGHQIPGLTQEYGRVYVIVEGFYRARRGSGMLEVPRGKRWQPLNAGPRPVFWADVEKFITGLEEAGVRVRRTRTSNETARVVTHVLQSFWNKPYDQHRSMGTLYRPGFALVKEDEVTHKLRLFAGIFDGIGEGRTKAAAQHFRSIFRLATSKVSDWEQIDGVGKKLAEGAYKAIHEEIPGSPPPKLPASGVPAGVIPRARSARHPRGSEDKQLDAGTRRQSRVPRTRTGSRVAR